jgi:hypothetical protein
MNYVVKQGELCEYIRAYRSLIQMAPVDSVEGGYVGEISPRDLVLILDVQRSVDGDWIWIRVMTSQITGWVKSVTDAHPHYYKLFKVLKSLKDSSPRRGRKRG